MKKLFILIATLATMWQTSLSQPSGPEILWYMYAGSNCAQFTSDDKYIVADNAPDPTDSLIVIETATGKVLRQCYLPYTRRTIKLSSDDSLIYSSGDGSNIFIHRFSDLKLIREITKITRNSGILMVIKMQILGILIYQRIIITLWQIIQTGQFVFMI